MLLQNSSDDWEQCERVHSLFELLCRVHAPPRPLLDDRKHCFSIQHGTEQPAYCSVPTEGKRKYSSFDKAWFHSLTG